MRCALDFHNVSLARMSILLVPTLRPCSSYFTELAVHQDDVGVVASARYLPAYICTKEREPIKGMRTQNRRKLCTWRDAITYLYSLLPACLLLCQEHRLITRSDIIDAITHFVEGTLSPRRAAVQSLRTERTRRMRGASLYLAAHNRHHWVYCTWGAGMPRCPQGNGVRHSVF